MNSIVEKLRKALLRADPLMMVAMRADVEIVGEFLGEDELTAPFALVP